MANSSLTMMHCKQSNRPREKDAVIQDIFDVPGGGRQRRCTQVGRTTTPSSSTTLFLPGTQSRVCECMQPALRHFVNFPSQITQAQAQAGSTPLKDFAIEGTCDGVTMAGGVFWVSQTLFGCSTKVETSVAANKRRYIC